MADDTALEFVNPIPDTGDVSYDVYKAGRYLGSLIPDAQGTYILSTTCTGRSTTHWDTVTLRHIADKIDEANRGRQTKRELPSG